MKYFQTIDVLYVIFIFIWRIFEEHTTLLIQLLNMTHPIPEDKLRLIAEMDKKIGEFMQKRADVVNKIIYDTAVLRTGDLVKIYDGDEYICSGSIIQPLFLKREGIITYRVKKEDGEIFTNETYRLQKI